jgi:hypothetical protein
MLALGQRFITRPVVSNTTSNPSVVPFPHVGMMRILGTIMKTFSGPISHMSRPLPYYAEIAAASRAMGLDIKDTDYERIDALLEGSGSPKTTLESHRFANPADALVAGFLPREYEEPLAN